MVYSNTLVGKGNDVLPAIEPGSLCVSRWKTLLSRELRLYVAIAQPDYQLQGISNMIVKFSTPMWYLIDGLLFVIYGPHKNFMCLQFLKHLNKAEMIIVKN